MRNPALLAAELTGRPLLMRESAVLPYAQMLGVAAIGERRSGLAAFMGGARRLFASRDAADAPKAEPEASVPTWMGEPQGGGYGWALVDGIGVISVDGPLMEHGFGWGDCWYHGYDTLLAAYEEMVGDANVLGIFGRIKTNGGVAAPGLPQLAAFLRNNRAKAGGKPIWFYCDTAYSAGYWKVSAGDRVIAPREGGVGSMGAVITHCEISQGLKADGITLTKFKFGKKKTDGAFDEPLSKTATADLDADVQQCGRWFVADVLAGRENLTEEAVLATEAGCFFGDSDDPAYSALKQGLVDAVQTEREAFAELKALIGAPISPAGGGNPSPAPTKVEETDVKRSQVLAGLKKAGLNKQQIDAAMAEIPAEDEEDDGEAEPAAENEDEEVAGEGEGDEEAEPKAGKVDAKVAQTVLELPEAKGRETLARKLAFQPGMTVATARDLLASAGKTSTLSERMQGRDPNLSSSGGKVEANLKARLDPDKIYARRAGKAKKAA